ncbi:MAG: hypothetical protein HYW77_01710 [Parcubacteria group bacterium]|nr:hypothetical protein [Parcubacteria group bacterium]
MPSADDFQPYVESPKLIKINDIADVKLKYIPVPVRAKVIGFYEGEPIFERVDSSGKHVPYPRIHQDAYDYYLKVEA